MFKYIKYNSTFNYNNIRNILKLLNYKIFNYIFIIIDKIIKLHIYIF